MPERKVAAKKTRAARRLARDLAKAPEGLAVTDVGRPGDGWIVIELPAAGLDDEDLSPALRDVLAGVVRGDSNAAIARRRGVSVRTVDNQVAALLARYGAKSRVDLARIASKPRPR